MPMMMPGMGFGGAMKGAGKGKDKEEKMISDVKLQGFKAAAKIKVIKEVRGFTDLGLKEAKELIEKAPTLLKKGVTKEEAEKIIQKMMEVGAKVSIEITTSWLGTRLLNTLPCRVQSALNSCFSNFNISFAGKRTCCIS
ncbi:hypothetical protein V6N13_124837 [Hibiscus sabdariffa]